MAQDEREANRLPRPAQTVEIAACIVVVTLTAGLLASALRQNAALSERQMCMGNLRTIGVALRAYVNDHDGAWPVFANYWRPGLFPACPAAKPAVRHASSIPGYAYNALLSHDSRTASPPLVPVRDAEIAFPHLTVVVSEQAADIVSTISTHPFGRPGTPLQGYEDAARRHGGGAHYLFCDGHVEWLRPEQVRTPQEAIFHSSDANNSGRLTPGWTGNDGSGPSFAL